MPQKTEATALYLRAVREADASVLAFVSQVPRADSSSDVTPKAAVIPPTSLQRLRSKIRLALEAAIEQQTISTKDQ